MAPRAMGENLSKLSCPWGTDEEMNGFIREFRNDVARNARYPESGVQYYLNTSRGRAGVVTNSMKYILGKLQQRSELAGYIQFL